MVKQKTMASLTAKDIQRALAQFDKLGREAFLAKHGFRPSLRYFIVHEGRRYDSKAVLGAAMHKGPKEFSGGQATVQSRLELLGFKVRVV